MTLRSHTFTVHGDAKPAGSKRAFVNQHTGKVSVTDANPNSRPWKQEVAAAAAVEWARLGWEPFTGPVAFYVVFARVRPKAHYGSGRNAGVVKPSAPSYPATRPDATKLVRGVEDALTGIAWRDDAQVVEQLALKVFGAQARTVITISEIEGTVADMALVDATSLTFTARDAARWAA